ncbi:hypothetical protein H261_10527 [Paramagnetospirillum caucaseum]|uniref:Uncharacterized protein n=1 Tax=Paramagnetospirillum caucaseum TaxID=1244869 RepID=M3AAZ1_9PROT|nr:hypothetical protein H261_10527 [Paramagnetospirillum caucaseum]
MPSIQLGLFGKTSPESCPPATTPSDVFWADWPEKMVRSSRQGENGRTLVLSLDPRAQSRGGCSTPNISAWPNAAAVCSLSQVLETGPIPSKYFLSAKACAGIIRRAEKRNKVLPPRLMLALAEAAKRHSPPAAD